ncbi:MAG: hypothetical protein Kow0069_26190 [Promethearchaeota archaeon]
MSDEGPQFTVVVKPEAYLKMVLHTLRYGSHALPKSQWREIMGTCVGKMEDGNPVIYDAVPMAHGRRIEVEWSEEQYIQQSAVDDEITQKGMFVVAWYHSHPGMGPFLSAADKRNHLYFQQVNPQATALVFDHALLDEGLGFEAFRLTDVDAGVNSDFEKVPVVVEPPSELSIFEHVWRVVHNVHQKDPIISELGETADIFDAFETGQTEDTPDAFIDVDAATKVLKEAFSKIGLPEDLVGELVPKLVESLNQWTTTTTRKVTNNTAITLMTLRKMKDALSDGLQRLQNWFRRTLRDELADLSMDLYNIQEELKEVAKAAKSAASKAPADQEAALEATTGEKAEGGASGASGGEGGK